MKGGSQKTRKREPKRTAAKKVASDAGSSQATEESNAVPGNDLAASPLLVTPKRGRGPKRQEAHLTSTPVHSPSADILSNTSKPSTRAKQVELANAVPGNDLAASPLLVTPKRGRGRKRQEAHLTSTPVHSSSADILSNTSKPSTRAKQVQQENAVPRNDLAVSSLPSTPKRGRGRKRQKLEAHLTTTPVHSSSTDILSNISESTRAKQVELEYTEVITQLKTSEVDSPCCQSTFQSRRRRTQASQPRQLRKRGTKEQTCSTTNGPTAKRRRGRPQKAETGDLQKDTTTLSSKRSRPRFELEKPDSAEQDDSLLSSDLSIELSHCEEQPPSLSFQEDEGSEEDELPSFLMQMDTKPPSILAGGFVWYKYRNYPFWPALVKSVNRKQKKASIIFIDDPMIHQKKGFTVALKTLKRFDCEEDSELVRKAKEKYEAVIEWSLDLIKDYTIRRACGSFSGSFIEYFAHDMSYPVRRNYPQAASERLTIASDTVIEVLSDDHKEDSFSEQHEEVSRSSKRLLPDRSHAAHNRANEKLVHFIVKQRMVEERLLAVIRGQQQSRWLRSFLSASRRRVVNIYLEDDKQLDQVYRYLNELYSTAVDTSPRLAEMKDMERVPFVLDVLLPEAIIYAIAGVDQVSVKKAEEKYLKGRCISNRERQEFDLMIERQMMKSQRQNTLFTLFPDSINLED